MTKNKKNEFLVKFPKPITYEEAVSWQTFYYDYNEYPFDPHSIADKLNEHFQVTIFRPGRPRIPGELAIAVKWPKHRNERKPIKTQLQAGVLIQL